MKKNNKTELPVALMTQYSVGMAQMYNSFCVHNKKKDCKEVSNFLQGIAESFDMQIMLHDNNVALYVIYNLLIDTNKVWIHFYKFKIKENSVDKSEIGKGKVSFDYTKTSDAELNFLSMIKVVTKQISDYDEQELAHNIKDIEKSFKEFDKKVSDLVKEKKNENRKTEK